MYDPDRVVVLLNLDRYKTEDGGVISPDTLIEVTLPRMLVEEETMLQGLV